MTERTVYLNGEFLPESRAHVSLFDVGFRIGDGVYDVARTFGGRPFKLREHVDRLYRSMTYTRLDPGLTPDAFEKVCLEVLTGTAPSWGRKRTTPSG